MCDLYIIGKGPLEAELRKKAENLNLRNVFFIGEYPNEIVREYMKISDVYLSPSISEGFSIAQLEAMISGLPMVCTPVGAIRSFLEHNRNGFIIDTKSSDSIVKTVNYIIQDKDILKKIRKNAYDTVVSLFSCDVVANKFLSLLENKMLK